MTHEALTHHAIHIGHRERTVDGRLVHFVADRFLLLPVGALAALIWANVQPDSYFTFTHQAAFAVNEIGMALFLALVTQEIVEAVMPGGALHTWRRWAMALVAAAGGTLGAAFTYLAYVGLKYEQVLAQAWPVTCAIDLAAAYFVVKLICRRSGALPFVLLVAIATDAFGLLIVALRSPVTQSSGVSLGLIAIALGMAAILRRRNVRSFWPYLVVCGPVSWFAFYLAGLHPALALVPIVPFLPHEPRDVDLLEDLPDRDRIRHFEHEWFYAVQIVLFLFALVNAGVLLRGYGTGTWALLTASLVGRPLGIIAAVVIALAAGLHLPARVHVREVSVAAFAASTGFTYALFFATGLLPMGPVLAEVKLGALATAAGVLAAFGAARLLRVGRFAE